MLTTCHHCRYNLFSQLWSFGRYPHSLLVQALSIRRSQRRHRSTRLDDQTSAHFDDVLKFPVPSPLAFPETSARAMFSIRRQTAAEAEWLQDDTDDNSRNPPSLTHDSLGGLTRFDWRPRALSRVRREQGKDVPPAAYIRRIRPTSPETINPAYTDAVTNYIMKQVKITTCYPKNLISNSPSSDLNIY